MAGQYCVGAEEEEEEEEEAAAGCSQQCPFWGGLSVRVMGMHPALGAHDLSDWEGAPNRARGMTGLCMDTTAFKPFPQPC